MDWIDNAIKTFHSGVLPSLQKRSISLLAYIYYERKFQNNSRTIPKLSPLIVYIKGHQVIQQFIRKLLLLSNQSNKSLQNVYLNSVKISKDDMIRYVIFATIFGFSLCDEYIEWCEESDVRRRISSGDCNQFSLVYPSPRCICIKGM